MAVKLGRVIFRKVGGVFVPMRNTAKGIGTRSVRVLPKLPAPRPASDYFNIKGGFLNAPFHLQRKGSEKTVGRIRSGFEKYDIGVKSKDPSKIVDNFAKYSFMNLHSQGYWKNKAYGTLRLKNIRVADVKATSIEDIFTSMRLKRQEYEKAAHGIELAFSKKAHKKITEAFRKGGKLKVNTGGETARLVSGVDRKINARAKGVRFIKKNGRIIPIRPKRVKK